MSALKKYQYSPLESLSSYRLLILYRDEADDPLKGDLLEKTIDHSPPYACLSYAWEHSETSRNIDIHGQNISISNAAYLALQWIRAEQKESAPRPIWIDSICINQDDVNERSQQVRHMKRIYSGAEQVYVYLGKEADDSDQIPQFYLKLRDFALKWYADGLHQVRGDRFEFPADEEYESMGLPAKRNPVWNANLAFLRRPWFLRTWIIQEVVLAREILFICGNWGFGGHGLIGGWHVILGAALGFPKPSSRDENTLEGRAIHQIKLMLDLGMGEDEKQSASLIGLLHMSRQALASNPRDRVYGLLGLTSDLYRSKVIVDYEEPVANTYRRIAKTIIELGDGITLLYNVYGLSSELDLPSWVPDWSAQDVPLFHLAPVGGPSDKTDLPYACAGGEHPNLHLGLEGDVLTCKGYLVDTIETVTELHNIDKVEEELFNDNGTYTIDNSNVRKAKASYRILSRILSEMAALLDVKSAYRKDKHEEIIWRTAVWNRGRARQSKVPESDFNLYAAFKAYDRFQSLPKSEILKEIGPRMRALDKELGFIVPSHVTSKVALQHISEQYEKAEKFAQWATTICDMMRRCRTSRGYLGQVPKAAMTGDIICVIAGAAVPFTIRKKDKGYSLVGQCYLHGYMEGEALHNPNVAEEDIALV